VRPAARLLGLACLCVAAAAPQASPADEVKDQIAPFLRARDEGAVGEIAGQALADPVRPRAAPAPYAGVSVLLLPYTPALDADLDRIKDHLRDSLKSYMGAVADLTAMRTAREDELLWAGAADLVRGEVTDAAGKVQLSQVPAGEWVLLAWRENLHPGKAAATRPTDVGVPITGGYSVVTFWRMRLKVQAGGTTEVALGDRNVWMTGILENVAPGGGSPKRSDSKKRR